VKKFDIVKVGIIVFLIGIGFFTRFFPSSEPTKSTVFDESYFVPQVESYAVRQYFFDPHPHLGRLFMYYGMKIYNPEAEKKLDATKLGNKVENYKTPLDLNGIRFFPKLFGSFLPLIVFLISFELINWKKKEDNYFVPLLVSMFTVFENIFIVESRYALITPFLLFFMSLTILFSLKFYKEENRKLSIIYLILSFIALGLSFSTKWFSLSLVPFILLLICIKQVKKEAKLGGKTKDIFIRYILRVALKVFVGVVLVLSIYFSVFAWHFSHITTYTKNADEIADYCPPYLEDLKAGTNKSEFFCKLYSQFQLSLKYQKYVPELDFTKEDEIGSKWITWPIMARTISYYWQTDGGGEYAFVYLIGNPINWLLGLVGVVILSAKVISDYFESKKIRFVYILLLLLYFANWIPYAFISRVMYLYHYIPALLISYLIFGVVLNDIIFKKIENDSRRSIIIISVIFISTIILSLVGYFFMYHFTYLLPVSKEGFETRYLVKDWDMKWPGKD